MKKTILLTVFAFVLAGSTFAQDVSVDEILDGYFENTGGRENWENMKGIKITATFTQTSPQGSLEIPLEIVQMTDGRQYTKFTVQGSEFMQNVYDGEGLWSTDFISLKAQRADAEQTDNYKLDINDFPDPFLNYKDKGYTVELMGTETVDGAETYKVKLTREPKTYDGQESEDVTFYYFDTEAFIPIAQDSEIKSGPQAGAIGRITQSDYQEVSGLYFPFSMTQGIKDGPSQPLAIDAIEVDPEIDESVFAFPAPDSQKTGE